MGEESRGHDAIELYQQRTERLIAQRGHKNYQQASIFLVKVRSLYEKPNEQEATASDTTSIKRKKVMINLSLGTELILKRKTKNLHRR